MTKRATNDQRTPAFSTTEKQRGGVTGKGFMPCVSGNAGGRPRGIVAAVRERTQDGAKLVAFMADIFEGQVLDGKKPTLRERMEAATWLADRGFGKAVQGLQVHETPRPPLSIVFNGTPHDPVHPKAEVAWDATAL